MKHPESRVRVMAVFLLFSRLEKAFWWLIALITSMNLPRKILVTGNAMKDPKNATISTAKKKGEE